MEALRNIYRSIAQTEKMAAIENVADPKIIAYWQNHGGGENHGGS
jgi:hypothetical protein